MYQFLLLLPTIIYITIIILMQVITVRSPGKSITNNVNIPKWLVAESSILTEHSSKHGKRTARC